MREIAFTIRGEAASKANSRRIATVRGKTLVIKSDKALAFRDAAMAQIPQWARQRIEGPVAVTLRIWYRTQRPDLDESLVLDCLQDTFATVTTTKDGPQKYLLAAGVYRNDRQVREKHVFHSIDCIDPRVDIKVTPISITG